MSSDPLRPEQPSPYSETAFGTESPSPNTQFVPAAPAESAPEFVPDNTGNEAEENDSAQPARVTYRGATNDPTFGFILAIALSLGLTPLIPEATDLRYTILWAVMAGFGVLAWLLGHSARVERETPENLAWGIIFGLLVGGPLWAFGGSTLDTTIARLFPDMTKGTLLAYIIFVMPTAETLFFRGVLQENLGFGLVGLLSTFWSVLVFFPLLNLGEYPAVVLVIFIALTLMNLSYAYVRERNGLAAAWLCQIVVGFLVLFLPVI